MNFFWVKQATYYSFAIIANTASATYRL